MLARFLGDGKTAGLKFWDVPDHSIHSETFGAGVVNTRNCEHSISRREVTWSRKFSQSRLNFFRLEIQAEVSSAYIVDIFNDELAVGIVAGDGPEKVKGRADPRVRKWRPRWQSLTSNGESEHATYGPVQLEQALRRTAGAHR
jgi:hypothetical protein